MRLILAAAMSLLLAVPAVRAQQVELDRTLERVYGAVIMSSDVRQVRMLKLAEAGADSDAAAKSKIKSRT